MTAKMTRLLAAALACLVLQGCAVVSVGASVVGAAVEVTGAVVATTVRVTGKVVEKTIDAVSDPPAPAK
jgi:PBP1b-binding outer membrane lipoprotein LpoB